MGQMGLGHPVDEPVPRKIILDCRDFYESTLSLLHFVDEKPESVKIGTRAAESTRE